MKHQLLEKALPAEAILSEKIIIPLFLGEDIHHYDCLITDFSYGQRLGDPSRPDQVLMSLSDEYIEELARQIYFLAGPQTPFRAQDLKEARETLAYLTRRFRDDRYFSHEDLALLANIFHHSSLRHDPSHLRYPPKCPPTLSLEDVASDSDSELEPDLRRHLFRDPFYQHYESLLDEEILTMDVLTRFVLHSKWVQTSTPNSTGTEMLPPAHGEPVVKVCPTCTKLFSRPRSEKRYFGPQIYCSEKCEKAIADARHYDRNKVRLRTEHREYMGSTRKYYEDHGLNYDMKIKKKS